MTQHGPARVLLAEDDDAVATVVEAALVGAGYRVDCRATRLARDTALVEKRYDALVTDIVFPDGDGLETLVDVMAQVQGCPAIVISAQNTFDTAIRAERAGAFDYLPKPFDLDELLKAVAGALERNRDPTTVAAGDTDDSDQLLVGRAPAMQSLYRIIARLADSDLAVLIDGESGTGKERVARAIHRTSRRAAYPFIAINMAAIPRDLIESELFGHEKGAFTGADRRAIGRFGQAEGGTLFLDEIGDMPIEAQTRLLRVLQSGEYTPVGGTALRTANVRIVAASNRSLRALIADGRFREDLFYRLNVVPLTVPPLRERRADIAPLARHFVAQARHRGLPAKSFTPAALKLIEKQPWPGNVRELENFVYRLCLLVRSDGIGVGDVRSQFEPGIAPSDSRDDALAKAVLFWLQQDNSEGNGLYDGLVTAVERPLLEYVLAATNGNQIKAARLLGINRNTLRKRLLRHEFR